MTALMSTEMAAARAPGHGLCALVAAVASGACASSGAVPHPFPMPNAAPPAASAAVPDPSVAEPAAEEPPLPEPSLRNGRRPGCLVATRWSTPRSRCAACPTATAGRSPTASTAAASPSTCSRSSASRCRATPGASTARGSRSAPKTSRRAICCSSRPSRAGPSHVGDRHRPRPVRPRAELDRRGPRRAPELELLVPQVSRRAAGGGAELRLTRSTPL